jgi:hypothetical protein
MNSGRTVFSQLMDYLPTYEFQKCVNRYSGDYRCRSLSCRDQFLAMGFAQLTYRESLRDIETCLRSISGKLYHMGFRGTIARSTLADANESRDWRIYADFAQTLIAIARPLYAHDPIGVELNQSLYALDSTTIDLCLSLFPWAKFRRHKAAVKMHTLLDLHGNIPSFIRITDGKASDVSALDELLPEAGAFYIMDRGYLDFARLFVFTLCSAFFIIRTKENVLFQRRYSHLVDKSTGVIGSFDVSNGHSSYQGSSLRLLQQRRLRTFAECRDFHLADRALYSQQQSIIGEPRIIDGFAIDQKGTDNAAKFQQRVPLSAVARQS